MVFALRHTGTFPSRLHGRQNQRDQDADDREHHQRFDQCDRGPFSSEKHHKPLLQTSIGAEEDAPRPVIRNRFGRITQENYPRAAHLTTSNEEFGYFL